MTVTAFPKINLERLKNHIYELSRIGQKEDRGIYRMAFSDADMEGRRWLMEKMSSAGLIPQMDGAGNVFGRMKANGQPSIIAGSHLDSVPYGGALDGSLGVLVALECATVFKEKGLNPKFPVEVVAFSDEEGRFGGMLGSSAVTGRLNPEIIYSAADLNGVKLAEEMKRHGLEPFQALEAHRDPAGIHAYLELHIEQGPVLDTVKKQIGIVDDITGLFKWSVRLTGSANHAGTTPMEMRNDAFMGLTDFAHEIPRVLDENGTDKSRATVGKVQLWPGSPNTVPGYVEFSLDVRDTSPDTLDELQNAFRKALSAIAYRRKLMFDFEIISRLEPVTCSAELVGAIENTCKDLGFSYLHMPSGAAHDAQMMAHITPTAMIFVPSREGKSHTPEEWTSWQDIEAGANVMLKTLMDIAEV